MLEKVLTIQYLNVRTNFCYLNSNVIKEIGSSTFFKLTYADDKEFFFSVGPQVQNVGENCVGINSLYARLLKLEENASVVLSGIEFIPKINSFTIHPLRFDDFHVLDLLKDEVENRILNQTSVVGENQEMLIWIGENLNIKVKVVSVQPKSPGRLDNLTELIILPQIKHNKVYATENIEDNYSTNVNRENPVKKFNIDIFDITEKLTEIQRKNDNKIKILFGKKQWHKGRLVSFHHLENTYQSLCSYEFNVFLYAKSAPSTWRESDSFKEPIFCSLNIINNPNSKIVFVRVFIIEDNPDVISINNIFVHKDLLKILKSELGAGVILKPLDRKCSTDDIEVYTEHNKREVKSQLQDYLAAKCRDHEFILNADTLIMLENDMVCTLKFKPHYDKYCCIDQELLRNCRYSFINEPIHKPPVESKSKSHYFIKTSNNGCTCKEILETVERNLIKNERLGCYLISGDYGSGKSKIIENIKKSLYEYPYFIYSDVVQSKSLKGKTMDSLYKVLITILENLVAHEPAILFIDDLEILCKNVEDSEAQLQNALHYNRISGMMYSLLLSVTENYSVGIVATVQSIEKVNTNIYNSRGTYLFEKQYSIGELTKDDRVEIMKHCLKDYHCDFDFDVLAQQSEGYVFQDVCDLIQRSIFQSIKDGDDTIRQEHCEKALSQMVILSHSDIKLHSPGDKDFSKIGGLSDIKKLLEESLMWPLKYHNLFTNAPLRLQSGLLLYGPPGTGKTILAGAAAKEFGVRLISIKGPELLSKYIGASEQAVRDVFSQAQSAKPCILFFDEFDSLAPRRGHDSTGVTDRVVNQLLTQMDGVESLAGVFVLAATSRPDLLDPALLRPGRLDRQVYCPFPDKVSRLDILSVLSASLNLSDDVNLEEIADKTDGFSGADLQSVLYNAQLSTMEHLLLENKDEEHLKLITQEILKESLDNTRPSLTLEERRKYDLIYSKFQGKSDVDYLKPGSKASLA